MVSVYLKVDPILILTGIFPLIGPFKKDIGNASLKWNIIQHGPCRPDYPGSYENFDERGNLSSNFSAEHYHKYGLWLSNTMALLLLGIEKAILRSLLAVC